mmetsp:Transcript_128683/g.320997  ORF Transcript_128683/g.320997 Transcript_128683/m.320997 type:complete len:392 (+) Transcript_128683:296-1471(+)
MPWRILAGFIPDSLANSASAAANPRLAETAASGPWKSTASRPGATSDNAPCASCADCARTPTAASFFATSPFESMAFWPASANFAASRLQTSTAMVRSGCESSSLLPPSPPTGQTDGSALSACKTRLGSQPLGFASSCLACTNSAAAPFTRSTRWRKPPPAGSGSSSSAAAASLAHAASAVTANSDASEVLPSPSTSSAISNAAKGPPARARKVAWSGSHTPGGAAPPSLLNSPTASNRFLAAQTSKSNGAGIASLAVAGVAVAARRATSRESKCARAAGPSTRPRNWGSSMPSRGRPASEVSRAEAASRRAFCASPSELPPPLSPAAATAWSKHSGSDASAAFERSCRAAASAIRGHQGCKALTRLSTNSTSGMATASSNSCRRPSKALS